MPPKVHFGKAETGGQTVLPENGYFNQCLKLRVLSTENPKVLIRECTVQESWTGSSAVGNPFRKMGAQITFNVL